MLGCLMAAIAPSLLFLLLLLSSLVCTSSLHFEVRAYLVELIILFPSTHLRTQSVYRPRCSAGTISHVHHFVWVVVHLGRHALLTRAERVLGVKDSSRGIACIMHRHSSAPASVVVRASLTSSVHRRGVDSHVWGTARTLCADASDEKVTGPFCLNRFSHCVGQSNNTLANRVCPIDVPRRCLSVHIYSSLSRSAAMSVALSSSSTASCAGSTAAVRTLRRHFYSGLDDSRVHRLRRSGMTFNRPRGRDTFSVAFESRLRIVPLTQMSDLYAPIDVSLLTAANADDPTSSEGNPLEKKKYMAGDARIRKVVEDKQRTEAALREKRDWHVLVVDPIELRMVSAPLPFPSPHPVYYHDWTTMGGERPLPSRVLEHRPTAELGTHMPEARVETTEEGTGTAVIAHVDAAESAAFFYASANRCHLQQNGDTTLLTGVQVRQTTLSIPSSTSTANQLLPSSPHVIRQYFHTAVCVDPDISHDRFHREEAQVEMISAYRNILYEAFELGHALSSASSTSAGGSLRRTAVTQRTVPFVADVVRVPALCHYSCGRRFLHELGKLNQQAVVKGFHRLSNEAKEALIMNRSFAVEIYVPPMLLEQFEQAFLEEPWEAPLSTLNPGRTALYPGLAPPRSLLDYDGWVGKRPELVEGVATQGKSLLRGGQVGLDGQLIEEREVLASLRLFGAREEQQQMLERERKTATEQLGVPLKPMYAPLHAGLLAEVEPHASDTLLEKPSGSHAGGDPAAVTTSAAEIAK
ncbi:hypothetical protein, conserved [Leishmania tarentolae]|uniref:Uncharacterized protein n=1 Tax=Leishmania tarentolae TaxID=5689 RepID=A0A640KQT4_LEITA|nr:hypothetical protein, conserved [Leishmania tarentolae]